MMRVNHPSISSHLEGHPDAGGRCLSTGPGSTGEATGERKDWSRIYSSAASPVIVGEKTIRV